MERSGMLASTRSSGPLLAIVVLLGALLGCGAPRQQESTPTSVATPAPSPTAVPTLAPLPSPSPSPPAVLPSPSPSPAAAVSPSLVVRGTGSDGLVIRREPGGEPVDLVRESQLVVD